MKQNFTTFLSCLCYYYQDDILHIGGSGIDKESDVESSVWVSLSMSEEELKWAVQQQLGSVGRGRPINLELSNVTNDPRNLKLLRSLLENYQIKTLSIVNSDGNHTELKNIVTVLKKHKSDFRNLAKNLTGVVHFCCFKSQNDKFSIN